MDPVETKTVSKRTLSLEKYRLALLSVIKESFLQDMRSKKDTLDISSKVLSMVFKNTYTIILSTVKKRNFIVKVVWGIKDVGIKSEKF